MTISENTLSMCEQCYRHVPAIKFEKDGGIWLGKTCKIHGYHECLVDKDAEFYKSQNYEKRKPASYWLDITNRCNLDCPHCYQMPDNKSTDPTIDYIVSQITSLPDNGYPIALVGAEATTRKDLADLILAIQAIPGKDRMIMIVTNGINLGKEEYAKKFVGINNLKWTIGLNHPEYNGGVIRLKQQAGIDNCVAMGLTIKNFTYTLGSLDQLEYVMEEVQKWNTLGICNNARIQVGVDIGRVPEEHGPELYLSDLVKEAKKLSKTKGWNWEVDIVHGNRTHYLVKVNGVEHRFIKWVDVKTIDFNETYSEALANMIPGKPASPLLHQVILRDRAINEGQLLFDTLPEKYR
jgi:molybdenum cofactor biosynthesis enzyme MoaA